MSHTAPWERLPARAPRITMHQAPHRWTKHTIHTVQVPTFREFFERKYGTGSNTLDSGKGFTALSSQPSRTLLTSGYTVRGDDPAQAGYWAQRRQKVKPPLDSYTVRLLSRQDGRCSLCGENLLTPDQLPSPPGLGTLVPAGHQEGDHGGLPGPPRHAQRRTQQPDTPRTRHLPPEQKPAPDGEKHRNAADKLNRPSGLPGPRARERACAVLRGLGAAMHRGYPARPRTARRS